MHHSLQRDWVTLIRLDNASLRRCTKFQRRYILLLKLHITLIRIHIFFRKIKGDVCFLLKKAVFYRIFTMKGKISCCAGFVMLHSLPMDFKYTYIKRRIPKNVVRITTLLFVLLLTGKWQFHLFLSACYCSFFASSAFSEGV